MKIAAPEKKHDRKLEAFVFRSSVCYIAFAASLTAPIAAQAQDSESDQVTVFERIIVTSNRRDEDVRDVAGSVDVVQGNSLEQTSAGGLSDYINLVPSVQLNDSGGSQNANISIRGVTTSSQLGITQQTVGIYINETPFTDVFSFLSSPDLTPFDLERVEVLRGPQGALYGSGSMGGAIRYITAKPELEEFSGKYNASLSYTEEGGLNHLNQAMVNLPLSDTFAVRGVISFRSEEGYVDNLLTSQDDVNGNEQLHGRIAALWEPTDKLSLQATYINQETESDYFSFVEDPSGEDLTTSQLPLSFQTINYEITTLEANYDAGFADIMLTGSLADKDRDTGSGSSPALVAATLGGFDFGLQGTLGAVGAYTPGDLFNQGISDSNIFSQPTSEAQFLEARISSKSDQQFRWMFGVLQTDIENFNPIQQFIPGLNSALSSFTVPAAFIPAFGGATNAAELFAVPANDQTLDFFQASDASETAIYGEVQFDITNALDVSVGGRYFDYEVSTQLGLSGAELIDIDNEVSEFQPRLSIGYDAADNVRLYGVYSQGYRVGGVNDTIALTLGPGVTIEDSPAPLTYDTDSLKNYEIGLKSDWHGGKLLFDLTGYYIDWTDIQLSTPFDAPTSPTGSVFAIANVGEAEIYGLEAQLVYQATDALRLSSSISYNNAELAQESPEVQNVETGAFVTAASGTQLPGSREWQLSNQIIYDGEVANTSYTATLTHQYVSDTISDLAVQAPLDSYNIVDARLNATLLDNLRVGLFADNILDEREPTGLQFAQPGIAPRQFVPIRPRTIGVNLAVDF